jgi:hypothetical protein
MIRLLLIVCISTFSFGGNIFSQVSGMTLPEIKADNVYTLDTAGINPRVYEFTPKGKPDYLCIIVFPNASGDNSTSVPVMQCLKK